MDLKEIKELIALMRKNDLSVFKMEKEGFKITLKKGTDFQPVTTTTTPATTTVAPCGGGHCFDSRHPWGDEGNQQLARNHLSDGGHLLRIALPGTAALRERGPGGHRRHRGLHHGSDEGDDEIKAECHGVIAEIVAENGKPVQYGQVLFKVR
ncbi:MAG: acetyl-CoA carboxylase, biotin carboxyl carrier protein [Chthoniobacter sp.]